MLLVARLLPRLFYESLPPLTPYRTVQASGPSSQWFTKLTLWVSWKKINSVVFFFSACSLPAYFALCSLETALKKAKQKHVREHQVILSMFSVNAKHFLSLMVAFTIYTIWIFFYYYFLCYVLFLFVLLWIEIRIVWHTFFCTYNSLFLSLHSFLSSFLESLYQCSSSSYGTVSTSLLLTCSSFQSLFPATLDLFSAFLNC